MQGNRDALAIVRVPLKKRNNRAHHRQREQLVGARKRLEAQGRSLLVNHGVEPVQNWWKQRTFAALAVPQWMRELLLNSNHLLGYRKDRRCLRATAKRCRSNQPRGLGKMTACHRSEIGDWDRLKSPSNELTGLCPGEYSSGKTRLQSCVTKHGNPRLELPGGISLETGPLPANYKPVVKWRQILAKGTSHRSCAQKSIVA